MQDLYQELDLKLRQLAYSVKELRTSGTAYAEAERDYKIALRSEVLRLRADGMAVGVIDKVCYGIPEVAERRFARDCAEVVYQANREAINALKLEIRIINEQMAREYANTSQGL